MADVRHLGFVGRVLGPQDYPRNLLSGLYRCAKFGWNRCSTLDNIKVLAFCAFGLKTPIYAPKIGVLGGFDSFSREHY